MNLKNLSVQKKTNKKILRHLKDKRILKIVNQFSKSNTIDGTIAVATEYGLNHTTVFPFVEFGAQVVSNNHIALSAIALDSKTMSNFTFKGNRSNLFG